MSCKRIDTIRRYPNAVRVNYQLLYTSQLYDTFVNNLEVISNYKGPHTDGIVWCPMMKAPFAKESI